MAYTKLVTLRGHSLICEMSMTARGWLRLDAGIYAIADTGRDAVARIYAAVIRLLDWGQRCLDVRMSMSFVTDFERNLDHADR